MGSLFSSTGQSSESVFLIGHLNGKTVEQQHFYMLSQLYLNQSMVEGDYSKGEKTTTESDNKNHESDLFHPFPQKKKLYCLQTYIQWKSNTDFEFIKQFIFTPRRTIYLVKINKFPDFVESFTIRLNSKQLTLFQFIEEFLQIFYMGMTVEWKEDIHLGKTDWNITERCNLITEQVQYKVTDFFKPLSNMNPSDGYCIMGISWTDLYPEDKYNFALGEATYRYRSGVFSFGRFPPSLYDKNNPLDIEQITGEVLWKLLKVSTHELGHLFGLEHCEFFSCLMNESLSITDAMDRQPLFYCPVCIRKIQHVCQFDLSQRYKNLENFIGEIDQQYPFKKWTQSLQWLKKCREFLHNHTSEK